ncbi:hypothetical protein FOZ62_005230, partial [Perkinsus olseni]
SSAFPTRSVRQRSYNARPMSAIPRSRCASQRRPTLMANVRNFERRAVTGKIEARPAEAALGPPTFRCRVQRNAPEGEGLALTGSPMKLYNNEEPRPSSTGRRRPIRRRLINAPSVPAPLVEYDRESSPDGAGAELRIIGFASPSRDGQDSSNLRGLPVKHRSKDSLAKEPLPVSNVPRTRTADFPTGGMLKELREVPTTNPLIITSLSLKGLADCGSLSRPRSAISSRARPRSGGYISQFAARRPNPRQTAPKHSLNDGRTGEGSVSQRLRPATASSVRPKTTG